MPSPSPGSAPTPVSRRRPSHPAPLCPPLTPLPSLVGAADSLGFTDLSKEGFPNLDAYVKRCEGRPAVAKAVKGDMIEQMRAKPDFEESIAKRSAWVWEEDKGREEL